MGRPSFRTINCDDFVTSKLQDNVASVFSRLLAEPDVHKVLVPGVVIGTGTTPVLHGLGDIPTGYIVVRQDGPAIIYDVWPDNLPHPTSVGATPLSSSSTQYLFLSASVQVTATLLVF